MSKTIQVIYEGGVFRPTEPVDLPEHTAVEVEIREVGKEAAPSPRRWGEGILRTEGALADDPYWDDIMDEIHQARKLERRAASEEP